TMAGEPHASVASMALGLALHPLDDLGRLYRSRHRSSLLSRSQRQAALPCHPAGRNSFGPFLDWALLLAGHLFPNICKLQQDLRNPGSGHRSNGVVVLDWIRD